MRFFSRIAPGVVLLMLATPLWAEEGKHVPPGLQTLARIYAPYCSLDEESQSLLFSDGTRIPYDDGLEKESYEALLDRASLRDQMEQVYPAGWPFELPAINHDPGRVRHEGFFRKIYGATAEEVRARLVAVPWLHGKSISMTRINGVDKALGRVRDKLADESPEVQALVKKPLGSFNWRVIAGTGRLSMHSFGLALDFEFPSGAHRYWLWTGRDRDGELAYPSELLHTPGLAVIVKIFESEGFIWGGKWYHYDTMHFEYRPELLDCPEGE